jgi:asparagine synthetase A
MFIRPEDFLGLIELNDEQSLQRLRSETATESVWEEIINKHPHARRAVTLNKTLPENILRLLARDTDPLVRADIAMRRALPEDIFAILSKDPEETVRARIVCNRKTPRALIQKLTDDSSIVVSSSAKKQLLK